VSLALPSSFPPPVQRPLHFEAAGRTDPGRVRPHNEDAFGVQVSAGLLVVADGLGGHAAGEVASRMAVDTLCEAFGPHASWSPGSGVAPLSAREMLTSAIQHANARIFASAQQSPAMQGMGTTIVAALAFGGRALIAHVGDSRALLLRKRRLSQLTIDHTIANELGPRGVDPYANGLRPGMLSRAVGTDERVEVETRFFEPQAGDVLLLSSDGLTNVVREDEIAAILHKHADLNVAADELIERANDHGGPDNVTVVLGAWTDRGRSPSAAHARATV
jgi:serine/threonine protein phosphatase PrpC